MSFSHYGSELLVGGECHLQGAFKLNRNIWGLSRKGGFEVL